MAMNSRKVVAALMAYAQTAMDLSNTNHATPKLAAHSGVNGTNGQAVSLTNKTLCLVTVDSDTALIHKIPKLQPSPDNKNVRKVTMRKWFLAIPLNAIS